MKLSMESSKFKKVDVYIINVGEEDTIVSEPDCEGNRDFLKKENVPLKVVSTESTEAFCEKNEWCKTDTAYLVLDVELDSGQIFFLNVASTEKDSAYDLADLIDLAYVLSIDHCMMKIFKIAEMIQKNY